MIERSSVIAAASRVLDARVGACRAEHAEIGAAIADELGLAHPILTPESDLLDLGIWIDDAPKLVLSLPYLQRLRALPLSHVAVFLETFDDGLDSRWTIAQLARLRAELPDHRIVVTLSPQPTREYMAELRRELPGILRASGARAVELDLEGPWKRGKVAGFASLDAAGAELIGTIHAAAASIGVDVEIEVTTFPAHAEADARGSVKGEARLFLQTYPVAEARGEKRDYDGPLGPDRRPYEDVLRVRAAEEPGVEVCAGLAAWAQDGWPGEPGAAMAIALDSARRAGVRRIRWWSARHAIGASANGYAARAIEAARPLSLRAVA